MSTSENVSLQTQVTFLVHTGPVGPAGALQGRRRGAGRILTPQPRTRALSPHSPGPPTPRALWHPESPASLPPDSRRPGRVRPIEPPRTLEAPYFPPTTPKTGLAAAPRRRGPLRQPEGPGPDSDLDGSELSVRWALSVLVALCDNFTERQRGSRFG